jgi:ankyrin repeat protein
MYLEFSDEHYIKTLLSYNADINDNRATPALLHAVLRNDREMVDYLLDNGADINIQQTVTLRNALLQAANILDYDMVNHLLDRALTLCKEM